MTAEIDSEHAAMLSGSWSGDVLVTCPCGWSEQIYAACDAIPLHRVAEIHREHVESQPGYVPYFHRPIEFDIDDEELPPTLDQGDKQ